MAIPKVTPTQAELDSTKPGGKHRPDKHGKKAPATRTATGTQKRDRHERAPNTRGDKRHQA